MKTLPSPLDDWLQTLAAEGEGIHSVSESRDYGTDEADYDRQHSADPGFADTGIGVATVLREVGADFSGPAVEIGCGTGFLTLGLAQANAYPRLLATDPSPAFLRITQKKLRAAEIDDSAMRFAVLAAEDIDQLPKELFSAVVLRSSLHHIEDVETFIRGAARCLRPGGALTFQEPCLEGFLLMAFALQTMPPPPRHWRRARRQLHTQKVSDFVEMVRFLARKNVDKSQAEDKHLFRVDELMSTCAAADLELRFFANLPYEHFAPPPDERTGRDRFIPFFYNYMKLLLDWPDDLIDRYQKHLESGLELVDSIEWGDNAPHLHGVFVATRR